MHKKFSVYMFETTTNPLRRVNKNLKNWFLICIKIKIKSIQFWISDQKAIHRLRGRQLIKKKIKAQPKNADKLSIHSSYLAIIGSLSKNKRVQLFRFDVTHRKSVSTDN